MTQDIRIRANVDALREGYQAHIVYAAGEVCGRIVTITEDQLTVMTDKGKKVLVPVSEITSLAASP